MSVNTINTNGARIEQLRNGTLIATYTSFVCQQGASQPDGPSTYLNPQKAAATGWGAFDRTGYAVYQSGDQFVIYGDWQDQCIYLGPLYNQPAPSNIQIIGSGKPSINLNSKKPQIRSEGILFVCISIFLLCQLPLGPFALASGPGASS